MRFVIRRAKLEDMEAIIELGVESVARDPLPVKIDRKAMRDTLRELYSPAHFVWVAESGGSVVAAVVAIVQPSFWYRGKQCSVMLHYSRVPGAWAALMREFARWIKPRSGIKVGIIELEPGTDRRAIGWLKKIGFARESTNVCYVRTP
jgi:hypothetical protein